MIRVAGVLAFVLLSSVASPRGAVAQVNPEFADLNDEIEMLRTLARSERKAVVEQAMEMLPGESQGFWPVYNEYEAEKMKINDRLVKLVTDYAAAYDNLGNDQAASLLADSFKFEGDILALHKKYAKRFAKVLPPTRVARFFQIERKLDSLLNLSLAEEIPLAN